MRLESISCRTEAGAYHVVVEAPRGATAKLAYDPQRDAFVLKKYLPQGLAYPFDFGFFPRTRAADGDPLDAMVYCVHGTSVGAVIESVPIAVVRVIERPTLSRASVHNDRVIVVPCAALGGPSKLRDLSRAARKDLEQFFVTVGELTKQDVRIGGWEGATKATASIRMAAERYGRPG